MTYNPSRYEHPYGIHLLDDIHNIFPEFMYDAGMFPGNQLQTFMQMRVNELFPGEFAQNRTNYRLFQLERRRREAGIPTVLQTPTRRIQPIAVPTAPRRPRHSQHTQSVTQAYTIPLTSLFTTTEADTINSLLASALLGTRQDLADLLTPVPVSPTPQQLDEATIVSTLEPPADITCAICQDHADPTENGAWRILRHCNHRFHKSCIDQWFRQNVHCPVCRHDIREFNA